MSAFWADLAKNLEDPKFRRAFLKAHRRITKRDRKANA